MTERRSKYNARKTTIDGHTFDSAAEARRYQELKLLAGAHEIVMLELQPAFPIEVNGKHICTYKADFRYWDTKTQVAVVEDVKGVKTDVYRLKKKLVEAIYGIEIVEVTQ